MRNRSWSLTVWRQQHTPSPHCRCLLLTTVRACPTHGPPYPPPCPSLSCRFPKSCAYVCAAEAEAAADDKHPLLERKPQVDPPLSPLVNVSDDKLLVRLSPAAPCSASPWVGRRLIAMHPRLFFLLLPGCVGPRGAYWSGRGRRWRRLPRRWRRVRRRRRRRGRGGGSCGRGGGRGGPSGGRGCRGATPKTSEFNGCSKEAGSENTGKRKPPPPQCTWKRVMEVSWRHTHTQTQTRTRRQTRAQ